jgi:hypothetical protein
MLQVLSILTRATAEVKHGKMSKFLKRLPLAGKTVDKALQELLELMKGISAQESQNPRGNPTLVGEPRTLF